LVENFMSRDWPAFAATVIGGWPILEEAWENLRKRHRSYFRRSKRRLGR
jgi:hypothetical protein